jgi:hypothetical protein
MGFVCHVAGATEEERLLNDYIERISKPEISHRGIEEEKREMGGV